jgi:hypothetical protein
MKKLVIIAGLVAILIGGLVGGTVFAVKPTTPSSVAMETGNGALQTSQSTSVLQNSYSTGTRHVSLTAYGAGMASGDVITVYSYMPYSGGTIHNPVAVATVNNTAINVQFDTVEWQVGIDLGSAHSVNLLYDYTVTFPSTQ